jgi:hypothetical protein
MVEQSLNSVHFEAVVPSATGRSMFEAGVPLAPENIGQFAPAQERAREAANLLAAVGFRVRHVGTFSVSGEAPRERWEQVFGTRVEERSRPLSPAHPEAGSITFLSHVADTPFTVPPVLEGFVERAYPQLPPIFMESPLPPRVSYHHLRVPADVSAILRSTLVHKQGVNGQGVLVAMPDTGFYKHPFYAWQGYNYQATLSPDAHDLARDEVGHGTAEAANIFANAPNIDFIGVKMGANATLAFKTASDLYPAVMTNSWGYDIPGPTLPKFLKPLEAAVIEAVRTRGITVCFSAGNGHCGFPGQMAEVISVGGVYANEAFLNGDFDLEASDYASAFDSQIYPGRHVPDVCGLVGKKPGAIYIMLPVEPGDAIDTGLSAKDGTQPTDGWAVISGTSAASPQIAGVCALLKQVQPGLSPDLVKAILRASARDVLAGTSSGTSLHPNGVLAGLGHDGATGAGLVDAYAAYQLARSVTVRQLFALPAPR